MHLNEKVLQKRLSVNKKYVKKDKKNALSTKDHHRVYIFHIMIQHVL